MKMMCKKVSVLVSGGMGTIKSSYNLELLARVPLYTEPFR